ncbi:hypothetical protein A2U01_0085325, partial [Trifolium medium]|nr:hypothetical protein [Trifolium medium]
MSPPAAPSSSAFVPVDLRT